VKLDLVIPGLKYVLADTYKQVKAILPEAKLTRRGLEDQVSNQLTK